MTTHEEVNVERRPGVFKRLVSRVRSNSSEVTHSDNSSSSLPTGNSNSSELHRTTTNLSAQERNRGSTPSFRTPTFKVGSSNANSSSPPAAGKKLSVSSAKPHPEAGLSRELWDEAYDALRLDPSTSSLVVTYESIISQELPDELKNVVHATLSPSDGNTDRRMDLMAAIASAGLSKRRGSKTSHVDDSARMILEQSKTIVESELDNFPSAALAWSGICTLTPLLIDPILRHEEFRRGMLHIIGRIPWYMHLTHLLQCPSWIDADDFEARMNEFAYRRDKAKDAVLRLYKRVLEFEMNCVCATASAWNQVAKHAVRWQTIGKLIDDICDADEKARELVGELVVEGPRRQKMLSRDIDLDVSELEAKVQEERDLEPVKE